MRVRKAAILTAVVLTLASAGFGQRRHDPLTDAEIDQLRDTAPDPEPRLKLYVAFARERLAQVDKIRTDAKITDRGEKMHEGLQSFLDVYDELDNNIDTYDKRDADLRKALKPVIEADNEFQAKLRALRDAADTKAEEEKQYDFVLSDALEALTTSAKEHRDLLTEQIEASKHKKKAQPSNSRE